jgi:nitrous oxidase accessory protein NosD/DNA-directed RNA polymerase subunit RPC12/RpoP
MGKVWVLVFMAMAVPFWMFGPATAESYIVDDDPGIWADFSSVQDAVNASSDGDQILVYGGTFHENLVVNVSIWIQGNGSTETTIDGGNMTDVIDVQAPDVVISRLSLMDGGEMGGDACLDISGNNCTIREVLSSGGHYGIRIIGTSNQLIDGCLIETNSMNGVHLDDCLNTSIVRTSVAENGNTGVNILGSDLLSIDDCRVSDNDNGGIRIDTSVNITVINCSIIGNGGDGITVQKGDDCEIRGNKISFNDDHSVHLNPQCNDNSIHHNMFINNSQSPQSFDTKADNSWDDGSEGNYWSDYSGIDENEDNIGDSSYSIGGPGGAEDRFPLMEAWDNEIPICVISSITPPTALDGELVNLQCTASDPDGVVIRVVWHSTMDGELYNGTGLSFSSSSLSKGTHDISVKVQDNMGAWSINDTSSLVVEPRPPTALIVEISPDPALWSDDITFVGTAQWGNATLYHWNSSIDGDIVNTTESSYTTTNLTNGTHVISLRIMNETGYWSDPVQMDLTVFNESTALPDLSLISSDVSYWPHDPAPDETIVVNASINNLGLFDVKDVDITLNVGGSVAGLRTVDVPRGGSVNVGFTIALEIGTWDVQLIADPENATGELSEDNNEVAFSIKVSRPGSADDDDEESKQDYTGALLLIILVLAVMVFLLLLKGQHGSKPKEDEKEHPVVGVKRSEKKPVNKEKPTFGVLMKVKCAECSKHFTIEKKPGDSIQIVCPFCGTKGKMK